MLRSVLESYPESELHHLSQLVDAGGGSLSFDAILDELQAAQAAFAEPTAPLEYTSSDVMRNDLAKHTRRAMNPQQCTRVPMTTAQEVGWEAYRRMPGEELNCGNPFHLRTSATTQFADAQEKHTWGRSIGGEFSKYASTKLREFGGFGMGI